MKTKAQKYFDMSGTNFKAYAPIIQIDIKIIFTRLKVILYNIGDCKRYHIQYENGIQYVLAPLFLDIQFDKI